MRVFLMILTLLLQNCNSKNSNRMNDYKEKILKINEDIKDIDNKYRYNYHYRYSNCKIEILVNSKLVLKDYAQNIGAYYSPIPINHLIKKDEKQKIKIRVSPLSTSELTEHSYFKIGVTSFENTVEKDVEYHKDEDKYFLFQFNSNETIAFGDFRRKVNIEGLPFFEKEFEFDGNSIPVKNEFLENTKDLRKVNQVSLQEKVLVQYQKFSNSVNNKKENLFWEIWYHKSAYFSKANYLGKTEIEGVIEEAEAIYNQAKFLPIENYEMKFYDEGRLVCFESIVEDLKLKGKSPLIGTVEQHDGSLFKLPFQFYFYMPKDSSELKIMY